MTLCHCLQGVSVLCKRCTMQLTPATPPHPVWMPLPPPWVSLLYLPATGDHTVINIFQLYLLLWMIKLFQTMCYFRLLLILMSQEKAFCIQIVHIIIDLSHVYDVGQRLSFFRPTSFTWKLSIYEKSYMKTKICSLSVSHTQSYLFIHVWTILCITYWTILLYCSELDACI